MSGQSQGDFIAKFTKSAVYVNLVPLLDLYSTVVVTVEDVDSGAGRVGVGRVAGVDTVVGVHRVLYEESGGCHHPLLREQTHPSAWGVKVYDLITR